MRLLADENIDRLAVVRLRTAWHDVFYVREDSLSAADLNLLQQATREQRTLLTYDRGFGKLVTRRGGGGGGGGGGGDACSLRHNSVSHCRRIARRSQS